MGMALHYNVCLGIAEEIEIQNIQKALQIFMEIQLRVRFNVGESWKINSYPSIPLFAFRVWFKSKNRFITCMDDRC